MNQTNVVVGKYNFIITETTMAMGTVISRKNYKIGGALPDCVNASVAFENNNAVSANMPHLEECSIGNTLDRGNGSIIMIKTLLLHIKQLYPNLRNVTFDDMSSIECASDEDIEKNKSRIRKKGTNLVPMPLYYLSIAYNGETWYEKHFKAVQQNADKHIAYKERVSKLLNDPSEKPSNYLRFFEITSIPQNINNEIKNYYDATNTYSEFFHAIPKNDRCRLLRPWLKEFMNYYLNLCTFKTPIYNLKSPCRRFLGYEGDFISDKVTVTSQIPEGRPSYLTVCRPLERCRPIGAR